ncbi:hypothetical protein FQN57_001107 [Myotisia sp. PD_48]|nr:hypothetical protein FQN57_001107 [Myotisia sp. PD_48]
MELPRKLEEVYKKWKSDPLKLLKEVRGESYDNEFQLSLSRGKEKRIGEEDKSYLAQSYQFVVRLETKNLSGNIRQRIFCVVYYRLKEKLCISYSAYKNDVLRLIAEVILQNLTGGNFGSILADLRSWVNNGERYWLLAQDIGGMGYLLVLPTNVGEYFWTEKIPKNDIKKRNAMIKSIKRETIDKKAKELGAHEVADTVIYEFLTLLERSADAVLKSHTIPMQQYGILIRAHQQTDPSGVATPSAPWGDPSIDPSSNSGIHFESYEAIRRGGNSANTKRGRQGTQKKTQSKRLRQTYPASSAQEAHTKRNTNRFTGAVGSNFNKQTSSRACHPWERTNVPPSALSRASTPEPSISHNRELGMSLDAQHKNVQTFYHNVPDAYRDSIHASSRDIHTLPDQELNHQLLNGTPNVTGQEAMQDIPHSDVAQQNIPHLGLVDNDQVMQLQHGTPYNTQQNIPCFNNNQAMQQFGAPSTIQQSIPHPSFVNDQTMQQFGTPNVAEQELMTTSRHC